MIFATFTILLMVLSIFLQGWQINLALKQLNQFGPVNPGARL